MVSLRVSNSLPAIATPAIDITGFVWIVDEALEMVLGLKLILPATWPKGLNGAGVLEARRKVSMAGKEGSKAGKQKGPSQGPSATREFSAQTPSPKMWQAFKKMFKSKYVVANLFFNSTYYLHSFPGSLYSPWDQDTGQSARRE